jgi:penicillin amidase
MSNFPETQDPEPRLGTRRPAPEDHEDPHHPTTLAGRYPAADIPAPRRKSRGFARAAAVALPILLLLAICTVFYARHWVRTAVTDSLPQLDGSLQIPGLSAPVTVARDNHGVPHIHAATLDDLVLAQGFVTAQDRLFQMDTLRRHAAGELAEIFGSTVIAHDRLQRTLQVRASADRAIAALPPAQLHLLDQYAKGVNASIAQQHGHLPIEFRVLRYDPAPWTPRDSILVALAMFEDLTSTFPSKLARESLTSRLPSNLSPDLYPVGSWRDHPPTNPAADLTIPGAAFQQVPLDESQSSLHTPQYPGEDKRLTPQNSAAPGLASEAWSKIFSALNAIPAKTIRTPFISFIAKSGLTPIPKPMLPTEASILASIAPLLHPSCPDCTPGSNNWVVSGAHTASGKPLLSNDMHLTLSLPGIWYEADLKADSAAAIGDPFHVAGVSLPGVPLILVGHNAHIAWGFTNLGADVQDLYIEQTRNSGDNEEFQSTDGSWQPVTHLPELIKVRNGLDVRFEVLATRHGDTLTPILNPALTPDATRNRTISLRWTIFDPANLQFPFADINSAYDWPTFLTAFSSFGGPSQNIVYADDQGHIGFHAVGRIPLRGAPQAAEPDSIPASISAPDTSAPSAETPIIAANPDPLTKTDIGAPKVPLLSGHLSGVPTTPTAAREWSGYIPFDKLPQAFDPAGGVLASANSRTSADDYPYPITLNWAAPYRNERIWKLLTNRTGLKAEDMLAIQTDIYSDFDRVLAQRLAYALDHSATHKNPKAADLLRKFDGRMALDSSAASIVAAVRTTLWPMLLTPLLDQDTNNGLKNSRLATTQDASRLSAANPQKKIPQADEINALYSWGEKDYALEQILMHTPPRWLPPGYTSWDEFLAAVVERAFTINKAPSDLSTWLYGRIHTVDMEHPIFDRSEALRSLLGMPTGTGPQPISGDTTTIKQIGHNFGPSERFTADLANPDNSTLNLPLGQSSNPASPWFLDQFQAWLQGTTFPFPFTNSTVAHTLTLTPR